MSLFTLYLISILPSLSNLTSVIGTLSIIAFGVLTVMVLFLAGEGDDVPAGITKARNLALKIALPCLIIATLIPGEKQLYMIAGGYVATNTAGVEKLPDNLVKAANNWLEKLAETGEEKKD